MWLFFLVFLVRFVNFGCVSFKYNIHSTNLTFYSGFFYRIYTYTVMTYTGSCRCAYLAVQRSVQRFLKLCGGTEII